MTFRSLRVFVTLVVSVAIAAGCVHRDDAQRDDKRADTSTVSAQAAVTTTVDRGVREARIDQPLVFDALIPTGQLPGGRESSRPSVGSGKMLAVGARVVVWVEAMDSKPGTTTSAQFGTAEVRSIDGAGALVRISGRVPPVLWQRRAGGIPGVAVTTPSGSYAVVMRGYLREEIVVREPAQPMVIATASPVPSGPAEQLVLGEMDLAGVAFGTPEEEAIARLRARFGPPDFDEVQRSACADGRVVAWGVLEVAMAVPTAGSDRAFASYRYSAPHAGGSREPAGLRTVSGLQPGASVAELRRLEPRVVFVTEPADVMLSSWYASPTSRLAGLLSDDVTGSDTTVVEISSTGATFAQRTRTPC